MANFLHSLRRIRVAEGGYQIHPSDTGNYNSLKKLVGTNLGINAQVYEDWIGYPPSVSDMRAMRQSTADQIFHANYWKKIQGDFILDQPLADIILDGAVNHGVIGGIKLLQEVIGVKKDGIFGSITLRTVNEKDPGVVYSAYKERRRQFYYWLARKPDQKAFLQGWLHRIERFNDYPATRPPSPSQPTSSGGPGILAAALLAVVLFNT